MGNSEQSLSKNDLRKFGLIFSIVVAGLFGLLLPFLFSKEMPLWPWYVAAIITGCAFFLPQILIIIYKPWMKFGAVAGWINTRIILMILFYVILTPTGLLMRLFGKDPMTREFDEECESYRVTHDAQDKNHMETPY
jgi:Saxitoxin biosynthesis operon protein SxtJ